MTPARVGAPRGSLPWLVGLGCLALTLLLYYPATRLRFVADDITLVRPNPDWLRDALLPSATNFHYFPVYQLPLSLIPALTGWRPEVMHALNFVLYSAVGLALFQWLLKLDAGVFAAALASLFFLSRGINYEVVAWVTGLGYLVVVLLTVATCSWWYDFLRGKGRKYLAWAIAGFAGAVFTIEHGMLLLPLYLLLEWTMHPGPGGWWGLGRNAGDRSGRWGRFAGLLLRRAARYVPFVLVVVVFMTIKLGHHGSLLSSQVGPPTAAVEPIPSGERALEALPPERMWHRVFNTPSRAYRDLLMAPSYLVLPIGTSSGADDSWLTRRASLVLLPWLALHVWLLWKGPPLARFLLGWMYLYLLPVAVASVPQARYFFLATVPAAGLVGLGLSRLAGRLRARVPGRAPEVLAVLLLVAVAGGESVFIRARLKEWRLASDLMQQTLSDLQQDVTAGAREVYLVNFPHGVRGPYWPAYAFGVAAEHLNLMLRPPRPDLTIHPVHDRSFVEGRWPTVGAYASVEQVRGRLRPPQVVAHEFLGRPPWIQPVN